MPATFDLAVDKHGRDAGGLSFGETLTLDVTVAANGAFIPGDRDEVAANAWMVRIAANKDCYLRFSTLAQSHDAGVTDPLFLAGTESMKLPAGAVYVSARTVSASDVGLLSLTILR